MSNRRKKEWFDDDTFWRELHPFMFPEKRFADAAAQTGQVLKLTKPKGKAVLDLCCGPGRWAIPLAQKGFSVTGVDRTKILLAAAKTRAKAAKIKIEWVRADMRDFLRPDSFDLVLSMLTSFGYFDRPDEDRLVLRNMFANLKAGGVCLIELAGKEQIARVYQPTSSDTLPNGDILVQRHRIADAWTRIHNEWILVRKGRTKSFKFHHTIYSAQELSDRLAEAGFKHIKVYGSLDGDEYGPNAQRLIVVARKPPMESGVRGKNLCQN
ncbi:MAG: class I SAM-dependent methyltransferase [Limisphaerales bacterium]